MLRSARDSPGRDQISPHAYRVMKSWKGAVSGVARPWPGRRAHRRVPRGGRSCPVRRVRCHPSSFPSWSRGSPGQPARQRRARRGPRPRTPPPSPGSQLGPGRIRPAPAAMPASSSRARFRGVQQSVPQADAVFRRPRTGLRPDHVRRSGPAPARAPRQRVQPSAARRPPPGSGASWPGPPQAGQQFRPPGRGRAGQPEQVNHAPAPRAKPRRRADAPARRPRSGWRAARAPAACSRAWRSPPTGLRLCGIADEPPAPGPPPSRTSATSDWASNVTSRQSCRVSRRPGGAAASPARAPGRYARAPPPARPARVRRRTAPSTAGPRRPERRERARRPAELDREPVGADTGQLGASIAVPNQPARRDQPECRPAPPAEAASGRSSRCPVAGRKRARRRSAAAACPRRSRRGRASRAASPRCR